MFDVNSGRDNGRYYVLDDDRKPVRSTKEASLSFLATGEGVVGKAELPGNVVITTDFTGIDLGYLDGPPYLFQTISTVGDDGLDEALYATWEEAEAGHRDTVSRSGMLHRLVATEID